jgi:hypothetical protein
MREEAFDPDVKMMATVHADDQRYRVAVKGAPEAVIAVCMRLQTSAGAHALSAAQRQVWYERSSALAAQGLRLLALATKTADAAVLGKWLAGYAPFWFKGNKHVIGVGMIPRGEVGLIFAQMGLAAGVLSPGLFSAVMVMVTTFLAPPLLKLVVPPRRRRDHPPEPEGIDDLVTKP